MSTNDSLKDSPEAEQLAHLAREADLVFRFAYCLTLSRETALEATEATYKHISANRHSVLKTTNPHQALIRACWSCCPESATSTKPPEEDVPGLTRFLAGLDRNERAVLYTMVVVGLSCQETIQALDLEEKVIRGALAKTGRALVAA